MMSFRISRRGSAVTCIGDGFPRPVIGYQQKNNYHPAIPNLSATASYRSHLLFQSPIRPRSWLQVPRMPPKNLLPLSDEWPDPDTYVDALLSFTTSSDLFRHLAGGVHNLDFLTREPDVYTSLLSEEWRTFFDKHSIENIIDLLIREDIKPLLDRSRKGPSDQDEGWRGVELPPRDLLEYVYQIRRLRLRRDFAPPQQGTPSLPRDIAVGMKDKKYHEVAHFSRYVDSLCATVDERRGDKITHIVDFGSGQSYLGRTLACQPYNRHIVAIERKHQYIKGARNFDVQAKLSEEQKTPVTHNFQTEKKRKESKKAPAVEKSSSAPQESVADTNGDNTEKSNETSDDANVLNVFSDLNIGEDDLADFKPGVVRNHHKKKAVPGDHKGIMDYIEHDIKDGYLEPIIKDVVTNDNGQSADLATSNDEATDARVMVVSLHSCGNLLHHGVRSLVLNPSVKAVAMIGCCYNLVTERLGPATWKLPVLRSSHPRLARDAVAYDPHGFPMSKRLEEYKHDSGTGIKINITARSMSLQAPENWRNDEAEGFFTRHFYRALLQRILIDRGVIPRPEASDDLYEVESSSHRETPDAPLTIGSLPKAAFVSFLAYVRAAVAKLSRNKVHGENVKAKMSDITDDELNEYLTKFWHGKKNISVVWTLMSLSATLVEATIVLDRWQFLREHDSVKECWVEPVFEYCESPRNLAIIGIKK